MENKEQINKVRNKIQRASLGYQAQIWDNGVFEIHNVKEDDYHRILSQLNRIKELNGVSHTSRYDFTKPHFGVAPQIYTIRGNFETCVGCDDV